MNRVSNYQSLLNSPKTLSVMLTFACPAECNNCGTVSSPRDRNNLDLKFVLRGIEEAKQLNFENVVFTGGESTLRWNDLLTAIRYADELNFPTRLVTNAHWAETVEMAESHLDQLLDAGLREINFSTGDEHIRFVPFERVIFATVATVKRKLSAHIMVELRESRQVSKQDIFEHPLIRQLSEFEKELVLPSESPWMPLRPFQIEKYPENVAISKSNLEDSLGCDSVLGTYVLQADKRIGACCGLGMRVIPELNVGHVEEESCLSKSIQEAEEDFLKMWIHYYGPEKILAWAAKYDPNIKWEGMYGHRCQACIRIYRDDAVQKIIRQHYQEILPEIIQTAWLRENYIPDKLSPNPSS